MTVITASLPSCKPLLLGATSAPPMRQTRMAFLDVVRGLAALALLVQICGQDVDRELLFWSYRWLNLGRAGIAAFFLVSGFVIPFSLERSNSLKQFWISRLFRIYPIYWLSLLIVLLMNVEGAYAYPEHWDKGILYNMTLFQEFLGQPHIIAMSWTITLEMVFYIAFSMLFALGMNRRSQLWAWLGLVALVSMGLGDLNGIEHNVYHKLPVARFALLELALIGTVIFRYYSGAVSLKELGSLIIGAAIALAIAMRLGFRGPMNISAFEEEWSWVSMFLSCVAGGAIFAVVFALRARQFPLALRWLGRISYSIYPMHYPAMFLLSWMPRDGYLDGLIWALAVVAVTCALSSAAYLLIERPAIELGRRLLRRPESLTDLVTGSQPSPASA